MTGRVRVQAKSGSGGLEVTQDPPDSRFERVSQSQDRSDTRSVAITGRKICFANKSSPTYNEKGYQVRFQTYSMRRIRPQSLFTDSSVGGGAVAKPPKARSGIPHPKERDFH